MNELNSSKCCDKCNPKKKCTCDCCDQTYEQSSSQDQGCQSQNQGDLIQSQGDLTESQGNLSETQGALSQNQGDQTESLGDQSQSQGDSSETQGDLTQSQGGQSEAQGDQTQSMGDQSEAQGDQTQSMGDQSEAQGDQTQNQGNQSETQGDQTQSMGDLSETQGDQTQSLGDSSETQGDLTESLGDQNQTQGSEIQGDQTQGNQSQGDQTQSMTGHGGQTQGEQSLISTPTISTPVNVNGFNLNLNVSCGEGNKSRKDCRKKCGDSIAQLLTLVKTLQPSVTDPANAEIDFYFDTTQTLPVTGTLRDITEQCFFSITPAAGGNDIFVSLDSLEALQFNNTQTMPNLFSLYLAYLQNALNTNCCECTAETDCCLNHITMQLQIYQAAQAQVEISTSHTLFTGYVYKIQRGIVYLADNPENPVQITAIPICKIVSYQQLSI